MKECSCLIELCPLTSDYCDGDPYGGGAAGGGHIDEETMNLIVAEHLLVDRKYLTLADEIGKGIKNIFQNVFLRFTRC